MKMNIPFPTIPEQISRIPDLIKSLDLSQPLVNKIKDLAAIDQGVFDLIEMWDKDRDPEILDEILKSVQDWVGQ